MKLSIIIPVAPGDSSYLGLLDQLRATSLDAEIIVVSNDEISAPGCKVVRCEEGRAASMNKGAGLAQGEFLWFVHADSKLVEGWYELLDKSLARFPGGVHYWGLRFLPDAGRLMVLNQLGVAFRCFLFKNPFGDQAFCVSKSLFEYIGGYPADIDMGEDHVFILKARKIGVNIHRIKGGHIYTSARKYRDNGWLKTVLKYQRVWIKQYKNYYI